MTPIQMANVAAIIANRGHYYTPHVVHRIEGVNEIPEKYRVKHRTMISPTTFDPVIRGMLLVNESGTAAGVSIKGINIAGKTGTVQNPHGKNHAAYMAFAPAENPRIAIAVIVEEAGYGATWAAPIGQVNMGRPLNTRMFLLGILVLPALAGMTTVASLTPSPPRT